MPRFFICIESVTKNITVVQSCIDNFSVWRVIQALTELPLIFQGDLPVGFGIKYTFCILVTNEYHLLSKARLKGSMVQ